MSNVKDLTGLVFGLLTVIKRVENIKAYSAWKCQCSCPNKTIKIIKGVNLTKGKTKSCGCLCKTIRNSAEYREKITKHGDCKSKEYQTWQHLRDRCNNPKNKKYNDYGGRGIKVCKEWDSSYDSFIKDIGRKPSIQHTIERIDNNGNYSCGHCEECIENGWPANCRWATRKEQCNNQRSNVYLTHNNTTQTVSQWADELGISRESLNSRLQAGWSDEDIITKPIISQEIKLEFDGKNLTIPEWAKLTGINKITLQTRKNRGWSVERILTTIPQKRDKR